MTGLPFRLFDNEKVLIFRGVTGVVFIDPAEVVFITADGNYSTFHFIVRTDRNRDMPCWVPLKNISETVLQDRTDHASSTLPAFHVWTRDSSNAYSSRGDKEFRCEISRDRDQTTA
ncbi:MAG: hypothetical protein MZV63_31240 [Marinilabiliales bacterium]|nr:hypothetical protein [Marinilabiliales bacterium]